MSIHIAREQGPLPGFTVGAMEDTMRYWLGVVCREQRERRGRLQVHVAASLDRNQSTVARFERGEGWPQDPDITITAYADDLEMDAIELWDLALDRWREEGHQPKLVDLKERRADELEERRAKRAAGGRRQRTAETPAVGDGLDELVPPASDAEQPDEADGRTRNGRQGRPHS